MESAPEREYAFEVAASNIRFGQGVTREVGMDFANMKATNVRSFSVLFAMSWSKNLRVLILFVRFDRLVS